MDQLHSCSELFMGAFATKLKNECTNCYSLESGRWLIIVVDYNQSCFHLSNTGRENCVIVNPTAVSWHTTFAH